LAEEVLDAEGIRGDAELSLLFVDEMTMSELNKRFMGEDGPTDVLAFPLEEDLVGAGRWPDNGPTGPQSNRAELEEAPLLLGDVVVCPSVASSNAPTHAGTYDDELALLVVHGILHVLGMDHADPEEAEVMQAKERSLLERFYKS
jgi:probable rRNA maturation factor